jgi:nicotinamidase-related amidase
MIIENLLEYKALKRLLGSPAFSPEPHLDTLVASSGTMKNFQLVIFITILAGAQPMPVHVRTEVQPWKNGGWKQLDLSEEIDPLKTAIVICDMWDKHWCRGATERVNILAPKIAAVVAHARNKGVLIIHAPSETMAFYAGTPQRKAILAIPAATPAALLDLKDPPLPIDDSTGGCDTGDKFYKAWTREHPAIPIAPADLVSDQGSEIYSALVAHGITHLLVAGVHVNMCILNRTFAIKQMSRWGVRCILLRDLTDSMYNPDDRPRVPHDTGTKLVIEHIERYWCPTMLSSELTRALAGK